MSDTEQQLLEAWGFAPTAADLDKTAGGMTIIRRLVRIKVRVMSTSKQGPEYSEQPEEQRPVRVQGVIAIEMGDVEVLPMRFFATAQWDGTTYQVPEFRPMRTIAGGGAEAVLSIYLAVFKEALESNGSTLIGVP